MSNRNISRKRGKFNSLNEYLKFHCDLPIVLIQGLGFVGSVMSLVVANVINGKYVVIGV
jgi:hypothetical protein